MAFRNPLMRNPVWQRQWQAFRSNKRGYWALWIFVTLFVLSLGAELIFILMNLVISLR